MNRTGKTNEKKGPHDEYNAFRDFHDREIEAHILASFLTHIGATSLKGQFEVLWLQGQILTLKFLGKCIKKIDRSWLAPDSTHNMQWMFPPPQGTIDYLFEIQETGAAWILLHT